MAHKPREYRLAPLVHIDLDKIFHDTTKNWSLNQAEIYYGIIVDAFEGLADGHKIGHPVDIREGYFRYLVGSHAIFFRLSDDTVDVIRVLHQSMDAKKLLKR